MSRKRRQVVLLLSSDEEAHEPRKAPPDIPGRKRKETPKRVEQRAHARSASTPPSQDERRGTLDLQLSQPKDKEAKTQRQLNFQPVQRTLDSYAVKSDSHNALQVNDVGTGSRSRGYGSQQEAPLPRVSSVTGRQTAWLVSHTPLTTADLVMHKKKIQEIGGWLELQKEPGLNCKAPRLLVLSGPPGCGKSTALHVLAKEMGFDLCEWQPPVPTLWNEHRYHLADGGLQYTSKLDDFETFVAHSKLSSLSLQPSTASSEASASQAASQQSQNQPVPQQARVKLVVIDDLPHTAGAEQRARLAAALGALAAAARFPVVIIVTVSSTQGGPDDRGSAWHGLHKELQAALNVVGVAQISCNPITDNNAAKALQRVAAAEGMPLSKEQALSIAHNAAGDLRSALDMLQLLCTGVQPLPPQSKTRKRKAKGSKQAEPELHMPELASVRDVALDPFHAIGKLLYNKRAEDGSEAAACCVEEDSLQPSSSGATSFLYHVCTDAAPAATVEVAERHRRRPLSFDPEGVWEQSGLDVGTTAGFLHENVLHFLDGEALEDAALLADYFSDVDRVSSHGFAAASGSSSGYAGDMGAAATFAEALAGSMLVRGVLYANAHPAPRRWLPLRKSGWAAAARGAAANAAQLQSLVWAGGGAALHCVGGSVRAFAASVLPSARCMSAAGSAAASAVLPECWTQLWQGELSEHRCRPVEVLPDLPEDQPQPDAIEDFEDIEEVL
ncbi:Cell cycle checkpoint protein RAD17 [Coccomyxa sp. Obi]|nr:Cell cycle checkpoint protein RAD17 [Coccomyxa sp. Obi]